MTAIRDIGGAPLPGGGQVRTGRLFRFSTALLQQDGTRPDLASFQLVQLIDLRSQGEDRSVLERAAVDQGVRYLNLPMEVARPADFASRMATWGDDPNAALTFLARTYRQIVDEHAATLAAAIRILAASGPAAFGCTGGKDRTGVLTALVHSLLGVPEDLILNHYAESAPSPGALLRAASQWSGMDLARLGAQAQLFSAPVETLAQALRHIDDGYGGVEPYLRDAGLEAQDLIDLRGALIQHHQFRY
jgi:protein-tyrosine phosphatase